MELHWHVYQARPVRVLAADAVDLRVDCGFGVRREVTFHLDIDIPEGSRANVREAIREWMESASESEYEWPLVVDSEREVMELAEPDEDAGDGMSRVQQATYHADVYRKPDKAELVDSITPA